MKPTLSTQSIAGASARHPWKAIGAWAGIVAIAIVIAATLLGDALTSETTLSNDPDSARADRLIEERLPDSGDAFGEMVVVTSPTLTVDDAAYKELVDGLSMEFSTLGADLVSETSSYLVTGDESLVSDDRHTTLLPLQIPEDARDDIDQVHQVVANASANGNFEILMTGEASLDQELAEVAESDLAAGEAIGLSVAIIVLALVFGAIAAAVLPIVLAIVAIIAAIGVAALVGQTMGLPFFIFNVMTMMGLAVGIDYSLFIISRFREERARGREKVDAITTAGGTAGRTVFLSGVTVALALAGLLIMPDSDTKIIGVGALLVVGSAVLASLTLLPGLLGLLGDKINALRIPFVQPATTGEASTVPGGFWSWIARTVTARPLVSVALSAGVLLLAASMYLDMDQGEVGVSAMPDGLMSKDAYLLLEKEFGFGQDLPAIIVIDGDVDLESVQSGIANLQASIAADPAFVNQTLEVHPDADLAILQTWVAGDSASKEAMRAIERLRSMQIPAAFVGVPAEALVTGKTAEFVDMADANQTYTPIIFAVVLTSSFLFLMVAFRSIVIPIKAILMNLLSVGAAYGLMVMVFQKGVGADLLGFQQVDVIQTGLPLFLFAILFGLSMDYHVFLLSRIRERYLETGDNHDAVEFGLRSTGRLISGAALIMVAVFAGFALGELVALQQMGFGLAVAVFIDATLIRCVLVPASMQLLGKWNWYLPDFLSWLPELHVEVPEPSMNAATGD